MDIMKGVMAVKMPLLAWIGLTIVLSIIGMIPGLNMVLCIASPLMIIAGLGIPIYMGYLLAGQKFELIETGIVVAVAALANGIISSVLGLIGMAAGLTMGGADSMGGFGIGFALVGMAIGLVIGVVLGFVLGVIGHFVYGFMGKKSEKSEKTEKAKK